MKILRALLVVATLPALVGHQSCARGEDPLPDQDPMISEAPRGGFLVRVFAVAPDQEQAFIEHLQECRRPVWDELTGGGLVSAVHLFELSEMETTYSVSPPWRYLLVAHLETDASAADFSAAERASACSAGSDIPTYSLVREAHMVCTPNSCFGMPEPVYPDAPLGIDFLIEFIAVEDTAASLTKYHDLMSSYIGPANGLLVKRGTLHCFVALETTANEIGTDEAVPWNQLHLSDHWDEGGDLDWDALYENLFREEFSRELNDVWSELPPIRDVSTEYRGRLIPELCVR
jgi:hypothetical protein